MTKSPATRLRELSVMSIAGVRSVDEFTTTIKGLLAKAQKIKPDGGVEPALTAPQFEGGIEEFGKQNGTLNKDYAAIETACRNIFYGLLVRLSESRNPGQCLICQGININRGTFFWCGLEPLGHYIHSLRSRSVL